MLIATTRNGAEAVRHVRNKFAGFLQGRPVTEFDDAALQMYWHSALLDVLMAEERIDFLHLDPDAQRDYDVSGEPHLGFAAIRRHFETAAQRSQIRLVKG